MPIPVNNRCPTGLHPAVVTALKDYGDDTAALLGGTVAAFTTAYEGIASVWAARDTVSRNTAWSEERRIIELSKHSDRRSEGLTKTFDAALTTLRKNIKMFDAELNAPVTAKSSSSVAAEIRRHVKDLPSGERNDFIQRALKDGDEVTLSALLGAPSYLSGLTADAQKLYTKQFHERMQPLTAKRLRACQAAADLIMERGGLIFEGLEKAVGADALRAAELRKRHDAATKALA